MKQNQIVEKHLHSFHPNELIFASKLYHEQLTGQVSESAYYKTLERMCKSGELVKAARGIYHLPKYTRFGSVPLSEEDIILAFTKNESGTIVGYSLYNQLGLSTQIAKGTEILSSALDSQTKTIRNIVVHHVSLQFTEAIAQMVHALDVLQNIEQIQDINYHALISYTMSIAEHYEQSIFEEVIAKQKLKKSTIAFLQNILNYYGKENHLCKYISSLSKYNFPRIEELYAAAQHPDYYPKTQKRV